MTTESFEAMRKRVLRKHKHSIVRSALRGHKTRGRGLVLVKFTRTGKSGMVHLSFLTLDALKHLHTKAEPAHRDYGAMIIEKISGYDPDSQIPVVITDGESEHFSLGVRRVS